MMSHDFQTLMNVRTQNSTSVGSSPNAKTTLAATTAYVSQDLNQ